MAIKFLDGFEPYAATDLLRMWTQIYGGFSADQYAISDTGGRRGGNALVVTSDIGTDYQGIGRSVSAGSTTALVGFAFKGTGAGWDVLRTPASGGNSINVVSANQGGLDIRNNILCAIRHNYYTHVALSINNDGTITAYRGHADSLSGAGPLVGQDRISLIYGTTSNALQYDAYHYIELKTVISESSGSVIVKVNGDVWLNVSGVRTQALGDSSETEWSELFIGGHYANTDEADWYFDDLYLADSDLSDAYNQVSDLLGDVAINYANVFEDGTMTDWAPSSGSDHFAMVDDVPPDLDSTYNHTTTPGDIDTFLKSAVPVVGASVVALSPLYLVRRTEGADTHTAAVIRDNGVNYSGSQGGTADSIGNTSTYTYDWWTVTRRPSNSATSLTQALVDAMEVGYTKVD